MDEKQKQILLIGVIGIIIVAVLHTMTTKPTMTEKEAISDESITLSQEVDKQNGGEEEETNAVVKKGYYIKRAQETSPAPATNVPTPVSGPLSGKVYAQALSSFEGRRFQMVDCAVRPIHGTFKNGSQIMIDGRSPDKIQTVTIGAQTVTLRGNDFRVITLNHYSDKPVKLMFHCEVDGIPHYSIGEVTIAP